MGVLLQAFYWDCPRIEGLESQWWTYLAGHVPNLARAGFTALWLPPACKAANIGGPSMGYDPYDYYDLGDQAQKGSTPTWFGTRDELISLISVAHDHGLQVYADLVLNHNNGADAQEQNPIDGQWRWTKFTPLSGRMPRDWRSFHPCYYETTDGMVFDGMPDLCHRNPEVYSAMVEYAVWLLEKIGFDGFRYDMVKGYGGWMVRAIQELRGLRGMHAFRPYGVGECWDTERTIDDWLDETNAWSDNPVGAFDFPLRDQLKQLCDAYGFSLASLGGPGTLVADRPDQAVTFVENHDVARTNPIVRDKMLAYAFILTHEGYPCVFWQDYGPYGLAKPGDAGGIDTLVQVHEHYAAGPTSILYTDDNLYIAQRSGLNAQPGLVLVLNSLPTWHGAAVGTCWRGTRLHPLAWWSRDDQSMPLDVWSHGDGVAEVWAPPRGYAVYAPQ
jgi:alpha-amylase